MSNRYEIRVQGQLDRRWERYFEPLALERVDGETRLSGEIVDQAALHSLLTRIRDLGLTLLRVERLDESNPNQ